MSVLIEWKLLGLDCSCFDFFKMLIKKMSIRLSADACQCSSSESWFRDDVKVWDFLGIDCSRFDFLNFVLVCFLIYLPFQFSFFVFLLLLIANCFEVNLQSMITWKIIELIYMLWKFCKLVFLNRYYYKKSQVNTNNLFYSYLLMCSTLCYNMINNF